MPFIPENLNNLNVEDAPRFSCPALTNLLDLTNSVEYSLRNYLADKPVNKFTAFHGTQIFITTLR
jgi:hypothetical protein